MRKEKYMSWDTYFMSIALISSFRSKDNKTQTGSCIVNNKNRIVGVGYNGLPKGLDDSAEFWNDKDDSNILNSKHTYVIHAEQNAIYNKISQNIENSTIYVTLFPCTNCSKSIIQVGIKKVVYLNIKPHHEDENLAVKKMFESSGIELIEFENLEINDKEFISKLKEINSFYG